MACSRSIATPWSAFKRLYIPLPATAQFPRASLSTSRALRAEEDKEENQIDPRSSIAADLLEIARLRELPVPDSLQAANPPTRLPRNVQALYLAPLRRTPTHGIPVCNLQLRSYSVRNLEFMADFALRAAYYLNIPARGPVPLPRITERWTVPRGNFVHKKSQENFERITMRRLVQIQDAHPEAVQRWLAFVRKWCWYGVGMKADVWEHEGLDAGERLENDAQAVEIGLEGADWELFGLREGLEGVEEVEKALERQGFGGTSKPVGRAEKPQAATTA